MAVGYRSSSATGSSDAQGTSLAVPVPAGAAAGDIALVAIEMWWDSGANPTVTAPAGFTLIADALVTQSGNQRLKVWWKRLTAGDTGSYSFSWTGTQWRMGHAILMTGAKTAGDPTTVNTNTATSGTAVPSTSLSPAFAPGLVHFIANENVATKTPPTSHTEVQDGDYLETNYRLPGTSGTFTASGATLSASSASIAVLIAIEPDAGGNAVDLDGSAAAAADSTGDLSAARTLTGASSSAGELAGAASVPGRCRVTLPLPRQHRAPWRSRVRWPVPRAARVTRPVLCPPIGRSQDRSRPRPTCRAN